MSSSMSCGIQLFNPEGVYVKEIVGINHTGSQVAVIAHAISKMFSKPLLPLRYAILSDRKERSISAVPK